MLLVDDDHPKVGERSRSPSAGPTHTRLTAAHAPPLVVALALGEARVHDRDRVAEALDEPARGSGSKRDLGDEHDRRAAALGAAVATAQQVDLRLARAGDTV